RRRDGRAAVGRSIVDDDHFHAIAGGGHQRAEAERERLAAVVDRNDDRQARSGGRRGGVRLIHESDECSTPLRSTETSVPIASTTSAAVNAIAAPTRPSGPSSATLRTL